MIRSLTRGFIALLAMGIGHVFCWGQDLPLSPQPVPADPVDHTQNRQEDPPVTVIPVPPILPPGNGVVLEGAPRQEPSVSDPLYNAPPGWFSAVEVGLLSPRIRLDGPSQVNMDLHWTASPRVFLGYRFCDGGAFRMGYRNLTSQGSMDLALDGIGTQTLHTRLDSNWLDLDYVSREYAPTPHWRLQWEAGARLSQRFLDLRAFDPTGTLGASSNFFGAGPHLGGSTSWVFGESGWALFGHMDGAVVFGSDRWHLRVDPADTFDFFPIEFHKRRAEAEADLNLELGVSKALLTRRHWMRFGGGIEVEAVGFGGRKDDEGFPFKSVVSAGPFLRWEVGF